MKKNSNCLNNIIISLAFVFNIFIFAPIEFYFSNIVDFWFPINSFLLPLGVISFLFFLVLFLVLQKLKDKKREIFIRIILYIMLGLYLQGNFMNIGYAKLDGSTYDLKDSVFKGVINLLLWIIILIPFCVIRLSEINFKIVSYMLTLYIIFIQIITLVVVPFQVGLVFLDKKLYSDEANIFNMSKDENTIFIMADTIQGDVLKTIVENNPEISKELADFTMFDNTTGCSLLTAMSMPTMLTGKDLKVGEKLFDSLDEAYSETELYDVIKENGYDIEFYTDSIFFPKKDTIEVKNIMNGNIELPLKSSFKLYGLLMNCVMYRYSPHFLKHFFEVDTSKFNNITLNTIDSYFVNDVKFFKRLEQKGITTNAENKSYKVIQLDGCHMPFTTTEDVQYDTSNKYFSTVPALERRDIEIKATLKILLKYLNLLKQKGIYDNTNIIFCSDHGHTNKYNPCLMIKRKNEKHDSIVHNNAPISMKEDFVPTIMNLVSNSKAYGKDVYDFSENEERIRKINNYTYSSEFNNYFIESNVIVMTEGMANDIDSFYIGDEEFYESGELSNKYPFNKKIGLSNNSNRKYALIKGFLKDEFYTDKGTLLGKKAIVKIKPIETDVDIKGKINVKKVYNDDQIIKIMANGYEVYSNKYNVFNLNGGMDSFDIDFIIPKDVWNQDEILSIEIETPNTKLGNEEYGDGWGQFTIFLSYCLNSIEFNK